MPAALTAAATALVVGRIGDDLPGVAFVVQVFAAVFEHDVHQLLFGGRVLFDGDQALLVEHEAHRAGLAQVAAVLREGVADLAYRAVAVVGQYIHNDGHAAGAVALEGDLLVVDAFQFAGAALDGALDVVLRHIFGLGRQNRGAQPGIGVRVAAALGGNRDFLEQAGEYLAALGIQRALLVLDCGPFEWPDMGTSVRLKNGGADTRLTL